MVFGWRKKKDEKKSQEVSIQKEITLDDVPKIVDDIIEMRTTQTISEIKSLRDDANPLMKELVKIGQTLEKDNLDVDEIDKHLRIIVVRGKKQVIDVIKKDALELPPIKNIDDALKIESTLNQALKKIGDVLGRQTRVIHIFAKKYAEKLKEILAQLNSNYSDIHKLIKNHNDTKALSEEIFEMLNKIKHSDHEIQHKEQRISEIKTNIGSIEDKINSLNASVEKIMSSDEYGQYGKLLESLDSLNFEKAKIKNQIDSQFTKISRPLGRYEYVSSDKEQKNLLSKLLEDPIDVMVSENKDMIIVILENIRKGIISGSISVKDLEKSQIQITETVEMLDSFIKITDEYRQKVHAIKDQINKFDKSGLDKLTKELEKLTHEKEDEQQKTTTFENEIAQLTSDMPDLLSTVESRLHVFSNTHYTFAKASQN